MLSETIFINGGPSSAAIPRKRPTLRHRHSLIAAATAAGKPMRVRRVPSMGMMEALPNQIGAFTPEDHFFLGNYRWTWHLA
mgnify:CR=1 FL=1